MAAIARIVGAGSVLASTELLFLRPELSERGLFTWAVTRTRFPRALRSSGIHIFDAICGYPSYLYQVGLQLLCGLALLLNLWAPYDLCLVCIILFVHLLTMLRSHGTDGADQMQTILLAALACYYAVPDPLVRKAAIWFVSLQAILAYFTSGVAKFWSASWRQGTILRDSLSLGLGNQKLYRWVPANKWLNQALCYYVIGYECLFPLVLLPYRTLCLAILGAGVLLHVTNAIAFGLPRFIFTFVATYPAILSSSQDLHGLLQSRSVAHLASRSLPMGGFHFFELHRFPQLLIAALRFYGGL